MYYKIDLHLWSAWTCTDIFLRNVLFSFIAENVGNFQEDEKEQSGSHATAWAAILIHLHLPVSYDHQR